jgi:hypothetical protein
MNEKMTISEKGRGALAYINNQPIEDNPHLIGSLLWNEWRNGWLEWPQSYDDAGNWIPPEQRNSSVKQD